MPMPNLREQLKSGKIRELGKKERRVGAAASDADRSFFPKIERQALVNQEQGHDQSPPEPACNLPYLPNAPPTANKPRRDCPDSSQVRLPVIGEPITPAVNKHRRDRPNSSRVRLPEINEPCAPSDVNKSRRAHPDSSRIQLPDISESQFVASRQTAHAPSDANKPKRDRPDASRVRLPEISESQFVSSKKHVHASSDANKPRPDRPEPSRVRLPKISESQFVSSKQPIHAHDTDDLDDDIDQYQPTPPAGKKPTRARAPSASVRFPPIHKTPSESQRKPNAGQSYSEYDLDNLPYPPKPPAIEVTGDSEIQTKNVTRSSRLPVRDSTSSRFNNPPKRAPPAEMVPEISSRPFTRHGHGVVSDARPSTRHGHDVVSDARPSTRHGHGVVSDARPVTRHGLGVVSDARPLTRHGHGVVSDARPVTRHGLGVVSDARPLARHGLGVVSGDMDELTSENGLNQMSTLDENANSRRRGVGHSRADDDGIKVHHIPYGEVDPTDPYWDMYKMDEQRRQMVFQFSNEFDEFVQAINESMENEKKEAKPKMRVTNGSIEKEKKEAKPTRKLKRP